MIRFARAFVLVAVLFPIQIVCGFAAAAGQTLAPLEDIGVTVDEVVVDPGGPEPGDPNDLGVKTGLVVQR